MVGDVIVDELEGIGVDFAKEPAGVEIGLFTQAPAQLGGELGQWGPHSGQSQFHLRMALVGEPAADIVGLEALQTDALGAEVGGEEPDPVLGVGMGDRQVDHPVDGHARGAAAGGEQVAEEGHNI